MIKPLIYSGLLFSTGLLLAEENPSARPAQLLADTTFTTTQLAEDSNQSMPLGNGDIGVNVWTEANGDLLFYISKSDAWGENSETLKIGKLRLHIDSQPFAPGQVVQKLTAHDGLYSVNATQKNGGTVTVELWVDAHHPQVMLRVQSTDDEIFTLSNEQMRKEDRVVQTHISPWTACEANQAYAMDMNGQATLTFHKDDIVPLAKQPSAIAWAHYNRTSVWKENIRVNWLDENDQELVDPLTQFAFGAHVRADGLSKKSDTELTTPTPQKNLTAAITVFRAKVPSLDSWRDQVTRLAAQQRGTYQDRLRAHKKWWSDKFDHSYLSVRGSRAAEKVSQNYNLQRYVTLAAGRGNHPIRFNGSIFTFDYAQTAPLGGAEDFGADYRRWGSQVFIQNTRLNYWPMLTSGDFDTMDPLFDYIKRITPALKHIATHHGVSEEIGAMATYESMTPWGTLASRGASTAKTFKELSEISWGLHYHGSALELLLIAVDRYRFAPEPEFGEKFLLPFADGVLKFYDAFFEKSPEGQMIINCNSLETYEKSTNPSPDIAGLKKNLESLLSLDIVKGERRAYYQRLLKSVPPIPLKPAHLEYGFKKSMLDKYGHWVDFSQSARVSQADQKLIAPAEVVRQKAWNQENPELYTIFPYRNFHIGMREQDPDAYDIARRSYLDRIFQQDIGWCQDPIQAAWLGLTEEAKLRVVRRFNAKQPYVLWPTFWKSNYDWTPDQDNGGVALCALQAMVIQYDQDQIYLCPAWPKEWGLKFKVHGPLNTTITGEVKDGELNYTVTPASRAAAVHSLLGKKEPLDQ
ncbi:MAG: hypothetical protein H7A51_18785 [Akkermansiaceae bacterium]|nr:hypothetical protein [Akkermansiaceae bacterium]